MATWFAGTLVLLFCLFGGAIRAAGGRSGEAGQRLTGDVGTTAVGLRARSRQPSGPQFSAFAGLAESVAVTAFTLCPHRSP